MSYHSFDVFSWRLSIACDVILLRAYYTMCFCICCHERLSLLGLVEIEELIYS